MNAQFGRHHSDLTDGRFLLQIHSVEEAGMCWGDLGFLYWWIRDEDLAKHRFDAAWMILQCS